MAIAESLSALGRAVECVRSDARDLADLVEDLAEERDRLVRRLREEMELAGIDTSGCACADDLLRDLDAALASRRVPGGHGADGAPAERGE